MYEPSYKQFQNYQSWSGRVRSKADGPGVTILTTLLSEETLVMQQNGERTAGSRMSETSGAMIDAAEFLRRFSDNIAPKMDAYEQVIYLFVYRHSVLEIGRAHV